VEEWGADETQNGLTDHEREPERIRDVHALEKSFVQEWLVQWDEREVE
jgi:hypothetical protein